MIYVISVYDSAVESIRRGPLRERPEVTEGGNHLTKQIIKKARFSRLFVQHIHT